MPSPVTASVIFARAAAYLNDASQALFSNNVLLPFGQAAQEELAEKLEENNVEATNELSSVLVVTTAMTDIGGSTGPAFPNDLVEIQTILERTQGSNEDFVEMTKAEFLPPFVTKTEALIYWVFQNQTVQFIGATTNREIKLQYIGLTLAAITGPNSSISLWQAKSFLAYRTAALAAILVTEDKVRGDELNAYAGLAMDRLLNINSKGKTSITTRRRPFMATFKKTRSV